MKKKWKILTAFLASIALVAFGLNIWLIDGLGGVLLGGMFHEDTEYAAEYSRSGWKEVNLGMTRERVKSLIGEPLDSWKNKDASIGARWSRSPGDTHFRCRVLTFTNGTVSNKHEEFYVD
jgi:hypothetical protein